MRIKRKLLFFLFVFLFFAPQTFAASKVNLLSESARLGISVFWDSLSESGMLEKSGHQISFRVDDPFVLRDFKHLFLSDAPELKDGSLLVTKKFIEDADSFFRKDESCDFGFRGRFRV